MVFLDNSSGGGDQISIITGTDDVDFFANGHGLNDGENTDYEIYGNGGNDSIYGMLGSDTIYGGDGRDLLNGGGGGVDYLYGGNGNDYVDVASFENDSFIDGGAGTDQTRSNFRFSTHSFDFIDDSTVVIRETGLDGDATVTNVEKFWILQEGGWDYDVYTFDELRALYPNVINGSDGFDKLYGGSGVDEINAGAGDDRLFGNAGNDIMSGGNGDDRIDGGDDNDVLTGAKGVDDLRGDAGNDTISGGDDNDQILGGVGDDELNGDAGNDVIQGGDGADVISGGNHHDRLIGDAGDDVISGDGGEDRLEGGDDNDTLNGGDDNDLLLGEAGDDELNGDAGRDELIGGAGNDLLNGGGAKDRLYGGDDADTLIGGAGEDILYGEGGADVFGFTEIDVRSDRIKDFEEGTDFLNITDILEGYNSETDDINDFVILNVKSANKAKLFVNADGAGNDFARIALINGSDLTGTTVDDLVADGTLITDQSLIS